MDQFYGIFDSYAEQLAKLPMFPVLQCVHYIIMTLKLRMGEGAVSFAYSHPMSSWVASILTCFAGTFLSNFLLGNSLLSPLTDLEQIAILSVIWYLVFFCPLDLFTKVFMLKPLWIALLVVKEAHRARNILKGVEMSSTLHHDAWLVMIAIIRKGAGSRLLRPVVLFAQGKVDAINEALYPSFVTKLSIVGSVLFIVVQKRMVAFTSAEVLLGITCVGAFLQVLMDLSNTSDPFTYLEKAVAAVLFREPAEKADTSDAKKKKE
ncbi:trimeric intracellular cation channel type A-like [Stylophora pistillata]|uniref:trimeric intracellular cation channel type A-like n=1 Tax=Stylophora pistillata TaxID=50429 RepID=UPI000C047FED|nr:trimeric intracellular cation channel type A-like [Stylophora pistillata]